MRVLGQAGAAAADYVASARSRLARLRWRRSAAEAAARSVTTPRGSAAKTSHAAAVARTAVRLPGLRDAVFDGVGEGGVLSVRLENDVLVAALVLVVRRRHVEDSRRLARRRRRRVPAGGRSLLRRRGGREEAVGLRGRGGQGRRRRAAAAPRGPRWRPRRRSGSRRARRGSASTPSRDSSAWTTSTTTASSVAAPTATWSCASSGCRRPAPRTRRPSAPTSSARASGGL